MEFHDLADVVLYQIKNASSEAELRRIERALQNAYGELALDLALQVAPDIAKRRAVLQQESRRNRARDEIITERS